MKKYAEFNNGPVEYKAPNPYKLDLPSIFLAGSIEMGAAEDWQTKVKQIIGQRELILLNPRRDNWDSSWEQRASNPNFKEQVLWELEALEACDVIMMYFDPNTKSPISLLELGIFSSWDKLVVCCPDGFWRKGNVEIVCDRYNIPMVGTLEELVSASIEMLGGI